MKQTQEGIVRAVFFIVPAKPPPLPAVTPQVMYFIF